MLVPTIFAITFLTTAPLSLAVATCGQPSVKANISAIVGGQNAVPYSWPWQAAVFQFSIFSGWRHYCGGTLISNQWILTAAHCIYDQPQPSKYQVKLGVYNKVNNNENPFEIVSSVGQVYLHPKYDPETTMYDAALLKLSVPLMYNEHVSPICLPHENMPLPSRGSPAVITGWGSLSTGGSNSATLRQATLTLTDNDECKMDYPSKPAQFREEVMFCAGAPTGGKDSCDGDSGGPLVYYEKDTQRWTQLGVISWGDTVCGKAKPGVYSKVSTFVKWIEQLTPVEYTN